MSNFVKTLRCLAAVSVVALAPSLVHAGSVAKVLPDFTVFVDPPTGFVFLKLPTGWKFVGRVDGRSAAGMPAGVVTSLLEDPPDATAERAMAASGVR